VLWSCGESIATPFNRCRLSFSFWLLYMILHVFSLISILESHCVDMHTTVTSKWGRCILPWSCSIVFYTRCIIWNSSCTCAAWFESRAAVSIYHPGLFRIWSGSFYLRLSEYIRLERNDGLSPYFCDLCWTNNYLDFFFCLLIRTKISLWDLSKQHDIKQSNTIVADAQ